MLQKSIRFSRFWFPSSGHHLSSRRYQKDRASRARRKSTERTLVKAFPRLSGNPGTQCRISRSRKTFSEIVLILLIPQPLAAVYLARVRRSYGRSIGSSIVSTTTNLRRVLTQFQMVTFFVGKSACWIRFPPIVVSNGTDFLKSTRKILIVNNFLVNPFYSKDSYAL